MYFVIIGSLLFASINFIQTIWILWLEISCGTKWINHDCFFPTKQKYINYFFAEIEPCNPVFVTMKQAETNKSVQIIKLSGNNTRPIIDGYLWLRNTSEHTKGKFLNLLYIYENKNFFF